MKARLKDPDALEGIDAVVETRAPRWRSAVSQS
jgi:hypothetical protein